MGSFDVVRPSFEFEANRLKIARRCAREIRLLDTYLTFEYVRILLMISKVFIPYKKRICKQEIRVHSDNMQYWTRARRLAVRIQTNQTLVFSALDISKGNCCVEVATDANLL